MRGLGESACDPTNTRCKDEDHCNACELLGCSRWARKFRLKVGKVFIQRYIYEVHIHCQNEMIYEVLQIYRSYMKLRYGKLTNEEKLKC